MNDQTQQPKSNPAVDYFKNLDFKFITERARKVLMEPDAAFGDIRGESRDPAAVIRDYAGVVAALPAIAMLLFPAWPVGIVGRLIVAILYFLITIASIYVWAFVTQKVAPKFGGNPTFPDAFKLAAYSATANFLASALSTLVGGVLRGASGAGLGFLISLAGLYSVYLYYKGAPILMGVPKERAGGFTAVAVVIGLIAMIILFAIFGSIAAGFMIHPSAPLPSSYPAL